jgi:CMP-N-acetylneuraminic acid synthetase
VEVLEKLKILSIIPARSGSKGVPKKNIKLLGSTPLIGYSIKSAKKSRYINKIIVSTDCNEIADVAKQFGIDIPFLRPKKFARDKSLDIDYIKHTLKVLKKKQNYTPDLIVLLRPTTPLRQIQYIDDAIKIMLKNKKATSLRSAHEVSESPFKWFTIKDNLYHPICDSVSLEETNTPRQLFKKVYIPNGYVDIIKLETIKKYKSLYGDKILSFITPNGYEIDTIEDFEYLEYKINKRKIDAK